MSFPNNCETVMCGSVCRVACYVFLSIKMELMFNSIAVLQNELTGEHTCIMLKVLHTDTETSEDWLNKYWIGML